MTNNKPGERETLSPTELEVLHSQVQYLDLENGRRLAFYVLGDPDGRPAIYFHGSGSHMEGMSFHKPALSRRRKVIVPDRPGIGFSGFQQGRTWLDWPNDVTRLADHLHLNRFSIMACSGGGPALLACARSMPERLLGVIDLACATPFFRDPEMLSLLGGVDRMYARLGARMPLWMFTLPFSLLKIAANAVKGPQGFLGLMKQSLCDADYEAAKEPNVANLLWRDQQEWFHQGARGPAYDSQMIYREWGFDVREIKIPIHIYHGTEDKFVPVQFSRELALHVPGAVLHEIPGQGHFYHLIKAGEVLDNLDGAETARK